MKLHVILCQKSFVSMETCTDSADVGDIFTQDSKAEDLFCGAPPGSESSLFFSNYLFGFGFKLIQDDFQHEFA